MVATYMMMGQRDHISRVQCADGIETRAGSTAHIELLLDDRHLIAVRIYPRASHHRDGWLACGNDELRRHPSHPLRRLRILDLPPIPAGIFAGHSA